MRTLEQMRERVRRLAHDLSEQTYTDGDVDAALEDAYHDMVDRMLDQPMAGWALHRVSAGEVPEDAAAIALPEGCLRLLRVQVRLASGVWADLPRLAGRGWACAEDLAARTATGLAVALGARTAPPGGSMPAGYRVLEDGTGIALVPEGVTGATVRMCYLGEPAWPTVGQDAVALPAGADELLELLGADKLTADEPRDDKRMAVYTARFEARWARWAAGRARGAVPRGQQVAGETEE